ncbi:MAG: hypothetical protein ACFB2Z_09855 [Maricaulaceae bacterium]
MTEARAPRIARFEPALVWGLGVAGVLVLVLPFNAAGVPLVAPLLPLTAVYYWSVRAPEAFSPSEAFLLGLIQDVALGGVIGPWAVAYAVIAAASVMFGDTLSARGSGTVWAGFVGATLLASGLAVGLSALAVVRPLDPAVTHSGADGVVRFTLNGLPNLAETYVQAIATIIVYPLTGAAYSTLRRLIAAEDRN